MRSFQIGAFGLLAVCISLTPSLADTGFVRAVITKSALVIGVGQGTGTLTFHGRSYPLEISGISFGATIGSSKTTFEGHAFNMRAPSDIEGTYGAIGGGSAVVAGAGGARLKNGRGVELVLTGAKLGAEITVAVSGVTLRLVSQSSKGLPQ
jgi:hypothetical protein